VGHGSGHLGQPSHARPHNGIQRGIRRHPAFAGYLLLRANRAPDAISALLAHTDGQPGWITAIMNGLSRAADHRGLAISIALAIACAGAASALSPGRCSAQRSSWQSSWRYCSGSPKRGQKQAADLVACSPITNRPSGNARVEIAT
jgi:hypothetical protein